LILSNRLMAEHLDVAPSADASVLDRLTMRGEEGEIRPEFVEEIARAIKAKDAPLLREAT
jgi:magnesium transporter